MKIDSYNDHSDHFNQANNLNIKEINVKGLTRAKSEYL